MRGRNEDNRYFWCLDEKYLWQCLLPLTWQWHGPTTRVKALKLYSLFWSQTPPCLLSFAFLNSYSFIYSCSIYQLSFHYFIAYEEKFQGKRRRNFDEFIHLPRRVQRPYSITHAGEDAEAGNFTFSKLLLIISSLTMLLIPLFTYFMKFFI